MSMTLLVLAAGMGSRYGGLKQLDPVGLNGEAILEYSVRDALAAGFDRAIFVIRADFEESFRDVVLSRFAGLPATGVVHQDLRDLPAPHSPPQGRSRPWGTAHAVWCARHAVQEAFLVVNADDYYGPEAFVVLHEFLSSEAGPNQCAMVAYSLCNTLSAHGSVSRGICSVSPSGELIDIEEFTGITRESDGRIRGTSRCQERVVLAEDVPVSMNFWGFSSDIFPALELELSAFLEAGGTADPTCEFYLPSAIQILIARRQWSVRVLRSNGHWLGVTYREDREAVAAALARLEHRC